MLWRHRELLKLAALAPGAPNCASNYLAGRHLGKDSEALNIVHGSVIGIELTQLLVDGGQFCLRGCVANGVRDEHGQTLRF